MILRKCIIDEDILGLWVQYKCVVCSPLECGGHHCSTHLCLNHVVSSPAKATDEIEYIHFSLGFNHLNVGIYGNKCPRASHTSTAVNNHWSGIVPVVVLADSLSEGQDGSGVLGHSMVRPSQEVELANFSSGLLVAVLEICGVNLVSILAMKYGHTHERYCPAHNHTLTSCTENVLTQ